MSTDPATAPPQRRISGRHHTDPSFFSTARSYSTAIGSRVTPGELGGYYMDFRFKAETPSWPPDWLQAPDRQLHVATAQWALGAYERYLHGEGDPWLAAATGAADHLIGQQRDDGAWPHGMPMPHTYRLDPPWLSSMAQGEGASLLVRVHKETGDDRYAEAAELALAPFRRPVAEGGVLADLDGDPFFEEYPTEPGSYVLNGGIYSMWGSYDVGLALDSREAKDEFERAVDTLARNLHRYDTGYWSLYDLYPHPVPNIASSAYHALHIAQLRAMEPIAPRPEFAEMADRFSEYRESRRNRGRAFVRKSAFRLAVPRNRMLARRMPWS